MIVRVLDSARITGGPRLDRKAREILTILAVRAPAAVAAPELIDLLWDEPPPSAAKIVVSHVSRLRRALHVAGGGCTIERRGADQYRLVAGVANCDVLAVVEARARARALAGDGHFERAAAVLGDARALWTGQLELPSTVVASALRQGWDEERQQLIQEHLSATVDSGHADQVVGELRRLTGEDTLNEPLWTLLVEALHRCGRQTDALRAAQEARRSLAEVGLEAGSDLREAERAVLRADSPAPPQTSRPGGGSAATPLVVHYAHSVGGHVAYTSVGEGARDIVVLNPAMLTIDGLLDERHMAHAIQRLTAVGRVTFFDRRGIGLSDPLEPDTKPLEVWADDIEAVLESLGGPRPVLVANFDTGLAALTYAARSPHRLQGLALVHCFARYARSADYPHGADPITTRAIIEASVTPNDDQGWNTASQAAPSLTTDAEFQAWWARVGRRAASPATAAHILSTEAQADVRHLLPHMTVPTIILHRRACPAVDIGHARYLHQHLPYAKLAIVAGTDSTWFTDQPDLLDRLIHFCAQPDR